jgi:cell division protein FtsQ
MTQSIGTSKHIEKSESTRTGWTSKGRKRRLRRSLNSPRARASVVSERQVPVMVRGEAYGLPVTERKQSKPKRRYDVPLKVAGAEIRLPALPRIEVGWRLVSAMLAALLIFLLYYAWTAPFFIVQKVDVSGLTRLSEQSVNAQLDLAGKPVFVMNPVQIKKTLVYSFPEFISVDVRVKFPNTVKVSVEERVPILVWRQDGNSILVDANGYAFPVRGTTDIEPSLVVEATSPPPSPGMTDQQETLVRFLPVEMVSGILSMSALTPQNTPIIYDSQHGLGWKDKKGWEVYFGDMRDIDMKLNVYKAIISELKQEKIEPVLISVEFVHAPYYRLER